MGYFYTGEETYPWAANGPILANVATAIISETSSSTYQTAGAPIIEVPLAMICNVRYGARRSYNATGFGTAAPNLRKVALFVNEVEPSHSASSDDSAEFEGAPNAGLEASMKLAKGSTLQARYSTANGKKTIFEGLYIEVEPLSVG